MSSPVDQQEQQQQQQDTTHGQCDTVGKGVFSNIIINETKFSLQEENGEDDLADQAAGLNLDDHKPNPDLSQESSIVAFSDEEPDEDCDPKLNHATTAPEPEGQPTDTKKVDECAVTTKLEDTDSSTNPENATTKTIEKDESDTPRLATYIKLHNDMMTSKSALSSDDTEQMDLYHHASHVARTLLDSHEKHGDLPLAMQTQPCLVLGCSDEDDCYERMQEALVLVRHAMDDGALGKQEGEAIIQTCELVMGMREQVPTASDDEGSEEDEVKNEGVVGAEGQSGDDEHETNDALP